MVEITVKYQGELRCEATHTPSTRTLQTDAPVDNQGRGESFSPTDLLATGLATCMATILGIAARREGWNLDGMKVRVEKHMTTEPPRRILRLPVEIWFPTRLPNAARAECERLAPTCPVALSIHPEIEVPIAFHWPAAGD